MFRWLLRIALFFFLLIIAAAGWLGLYAYTPAQGKGEQVTVYIPRGSGVIRIKYLLAREKLIKDDPRFFLLVNLLDLTNRLKAGEFVFTSDMTPVEVLRVLEQGKAIQHTIVIREGLTLKQIADLLAENNWVDREKFLVLCKDSGKIKDMGLGVENLEGYLFPDTYNMVRGETDEDTIIESMVGRFKALYQEESKGGNSDLSRHEVVTLASIIEKETGSALERPLISRVFLNRLDRGMRLQADPTVIYGIPDFNGNITRADLKKPTPYNTYVIKGLPPGPICNPGREAIRAVFKPAEGKYLYFVSKNDGTHYFSTSLKEHNRAVRKYQKSKKKRQKS